MENHGSRLLWGLAVGFGLTDGFRLFILHCVCALEADQEEEVWTHQRPARRLDGTLDLIGLESRRRFEYLLRACAREEQTILVGDSPNTVPVLANQLDTIQNTHQDKMHQ